jgi:hypothetical protein
MSGKQVALDGAENGLIKVQGRWGKALPLLPEAPVHAAGQGKGKVADPRAEARGGHKPQSDLAHRGSGIEGLVAGGLSPRMGLLGETYLLEIQVLGAEEQQGGGVMAFEEPFDHGVVEVCAQDCPSDAIDSAAHPRGLVTRIVPGPWQRHCKGFQATPPVQALPEGGVHLGHGVIKECLGETPRLGRQSGPGVVTSSAMLANIAFPQFLCLPSSLSRLFLRFPSLRGYPETELAKTHDLLDHGRTPH